MQHILYLFCVAPQYIITVPLVEHRVITNETLYGVSYFYAVWLLSMTLFMTL